MRKGIFTRFAILASFFLLLQSCGGSQGFFSDSENTPVVNPYTNHSSSPNTANPNSASAKSNNANLENFVAQIHSNDYNNYLVVEIDDAQGVTIQENRLRLSGGRGMVGANSLNQALDKMGGIVGLTALFNDNLALLANQTKQLEKLSGKHLKPLNTFFKLSVVDQAKAEGLMRELWKGAGIASVYPRLKPTLNAVTTVPDLSGRQGYFSNAETDNGLGIGAVHDLGVKGAGVTIVDLETAWNRDHIDFPRQPTITDGILSGVSDPNRAIAHGTSVVGILAALDDNAGVTGVAPDAIIQTGSPDMLEAVDGLDGDDLEPGSIILDEIGATGVPDEVYSATFSEIQNATAGDILVIDTAGDGSTATQLLNLDRINYDGFQDLRTNDSGSIIVGASTGATAQRQEASTCGSPVQMFAWGSGILTTSYPGSIWDWVGDSTVVNNAAQPNCYYTNTFGGTSPAAAIIAGSAALLQSHAKSVMGGKKFLTPAKMRELLIASGTRAVNDGDCPIGVQPRVDVALDLFDAFWSDVAADYPELTSNATLSGARRIDLKSRGVGTVCKLYDWANSDPTCPETARCMLDPAYQVSYRTDLTGVDCSGGWCFEVTPPAGDPYRCKNIRCLPLDTVRSDDDCVAGAIQPSGLRLGKELDFDGDGRADLVNAIPGRWKVDLSSLGSSVDGFGAWNMTLDIPAIAARWLWPVAADYNSDGRADISVYDKEHGVWYAKFTTRDILAGRWSDWDLRVTLPYQDQLDRDVRLTRYSRPVPGDYNNDGWIDLALARSDGIWSIDHGGPNASDYGAFDENITYLTPAQLAEAPGWAYLPVMGFGDNNGRMGFKVPDGIQDAGEVFTYVGYFRNQNEQYNILPYGGNEAMIFDLAGFDFGVKKSDGSWPILSRAFVLETVAPDNIYGSLDCHPFVADFDGDGYDDRAVQCPAEFRLGLSSTGSLRTVPLTYSTSVFSLPGKPYFGSVSYATSQRIIDWQLRSSPATAPILPVDMVSQAFCRLGFSATDRPAECR